MSRLVLPVVYPDNVRMEIANAWAKELQAALRDRVAKMVRAGVVDEDELIVGTPLLHYDTPAKPRIPTR